VPGSLGNLVEKFVEFHRQYSDFFKLKTKSVFEQSYHYLCGLMRANRKNMERMAEAVPNCNEQSLQPHISNSPWDDSGLIRQIGEDAEALLGNDPDTCLIVDESGFKKSGEKSVGVSRQWLGRLGKIDVVFTRKLDQLEKAPATGWCPRRTISSSQENGIGTGNNPIRAGPEIITSMGWRRWILWQ
jgi:hypothetical protein